MFAFCLPFPFRTSLVHFDYVAGSENSQHESVAQVKKVVEKAKHVLTYIIPLEIHLESTLVPAPKSPPPGDLLYTLGRVSQTRQRLCLRLAVSLL